MLHMRLFNYRLNGIGSVNEGRLNG